MKKQTLNWTARLLLPAALLAFTSCSSTPPDTGHGGIVLEAMTVTAKVTLINAEDRTVVLQRPDGSLAAYQCGPDVRNFDQIKVGDQVTTTVAEELAVVLVKGSLPPSADSTTVIVRTPLGDKPGGKIVDTQSFTARVVSVDAAKREVTLQMVTGENKTVKVGPSINLTNVKPGRDVGVRLTRAFAIDVSTPEPAPTPPVTPTPPAPTPEVTPTPEAAPAPPAPTPEATPTPDAAPTPEAAPTPSVPTPDATPTPDAAPTPDATPTPPPPAPAAP